jgi:hypothetical protein
MPPVRVAQPVRVVRPERVEPQHKVLPVQYAARPTPPPIKRQVVERHDGNLYRQREDIRYIVERPIIVESPTMVVNPEVAVPEGFETLEVNGQTFYYYGGAFYQYIEGQLTVIPAVLGAVVDAIPQDYQIVMADGVNYCVWGGVYYQRLMEGFQVVEPPTPLGA